VSCPLFLFGLQNTVSNLWSELCGQGNILLTSRNPKNNCWLSRVFGARYGRKDCDLCPYNLCAK
jgi:hypothetical protein